MTRVAIRGTTFLVGGVVMALLVACTSQGGSSESGPPTGAASSTASAHTSALTRSTPPSPGQTASPGSDTSGINAALVAEATKVNIRQFNLQTAFSNAGGLPRGTKPPMFYTDVMMDKGLTLTMDLLYNTFEAGIHRKSGEVKLGPVHPVALTRDGSIIALRGCRDGRGFAGQRADGSTFKGILIRHTTYYKRDKDGKLKVSSWSGVEDPTCGK